jgi:hypothetical protein
MNTSLVLRIASALTLLFALGHSLGGLQSWSPQGDTEVLRAMKSFHFDAMGAMRTYWDFYVGFGLFISVCLLLQAAVLWQLGRLAKENAVRVRPLVGSFVVAYLMSAVLAWRFIFTVPVVFSIAIAACLVTALFTSRHAERL